MSNDKGGLIRKKDKPKIMARPEPVKKTTMDFGFKRPEPAPAEPKRVVQPVSQPAQAAPQSTMPPAKPALTDEQKADKRYKVKRDLNLGVGKADSTKSLKVPSVIHTELGLLGSFMDENKTYVILQKLIDSYVKNELTDRQQRQFDYMIDAFLED